MSASGAGPAVEAVGVSKHFHSGANFADLLRGKLRGRKIQALHPLDLRVEPGEALALVGENGAGKSTLLRLVAGLLIPDAGQLTVLGQETRDAGARHRQRVCYVGGEERSFSWRLSGTQNLEFFAALHGLDRPAAARRAAEALERVGLAADGDRPVREYSTGMRQRLALARGLLGEPELLLLDEPTRGVDPAAASALRDLMREHLLTGARTTLLATHDPAEARAVCSRALLLKQGRSQGPEPVEKILSRLLPSAP